MWPNPQETADLVIFTEEILNGKLLSFVQSKFILNEIITIDDRYPSWINNKTKSLIKNKTGYFKNCVKPNYPVSISHFEQMQGALLKNIEIS